MYNINTTLYIVMIRNNARVVIVGGPGTGKSTIIRQLAKIGCNIIPEVARGIIREQELIGGDIVPCGDLERFQFEVAKRQIAFEIGSKGIIGQDRGLYDGEGYCYLNGILVPKILNEYNPKYDLVISLDPLEFIKNDGVRRESREEQMEVHEAINFAYKNRGYNPITIPDMPKGERLNYLLELMR
jgi:predicted ATPase